MEGHENLPKALTDADLDLVPTEDLVNAMKRRFDTVIVLSQRQVHRRATDDSFWWDGNRAAIVGLLTFALDDLRNSTGRSDEHDEGEAWQAPAPEPDL